jgi:hypothetical protein
MAGAYFESTLSVESPVPCRYWGLTGLAVNQYALLPGGANDLIPHLCLALFLKGDYGSGLVWRYTRTSP